MSLCKLKPALLASALALAGTAHAATVFSEGFDDVFGLADNGWVLTNNSSPANNTVDGTGWFQGSADNGIFDAQAGAGYAAANYNNAAAGGTIDNWLITPTFSTALAGTVTVWLRGDILDGFTDTARFGFSQGSSDIASFVTGSAVTATGTWTEYSFAYAAGGAGSTARFAIEYTGDADSANFIGVDTLTITAVPEPATWALFALGAAGVVARRRSSAR